MLDSAFMDLSDLVRAHAANFGEKPAIIADGRVTTWGEFDRFTNRIASALRAAGLQAGERVAALSTNGDHLLQLIFATFKAGGCFVPVSGFLAADQASLLVDDAQAGFFFVDEDYNETGNRLRGSLSCVRENGWVSMGFETSGWTTLDAFVEGAADSLIDRWNELGDTACLWYSSGTTGIPKGIIRSHQSLLALGILCGMDMNIDSRSTTLLATPLSASGTWINMLSTIIAGGTIVAPRKCAACDIISLIERHHVTHAMLVPTQLNGLLDEPALDTADLGSMRGLLTLGSKLHGYTKTQTLKRITPNLFELYGLTEGYGTLSKPGEHSNKPGSVGRPILGCEILIIDEDGNELPPGEVGEIVGLGPFTMGGYFNRPEETRKLIWKDGSGRVFLKSGDVGRKDEDGFVYILDRRKDMIITGGLNIYPADIEAVLGEHDDAVDLVVIGIPHPKWGETPVGLMQMRDGASVTADQVLEWANDRLAKHQRLSRIVFWDEFPRNALGKLVKHEIRDAYLETISAEIEQVH